MSAWGITLGQLDTMGTTTHLLQMNMFGDYLVLHMLFF